MKPTFVIHWKDQDGNKQQKEYPTDAEVKKAEKWLKDKGVDDIEIVAKLVTPKKEPEEAWYDNM